MIISIRRDLDSDMFVVTPLADDLAPLRRASGGVVRSYHCSPATVWNAVGELVVAYGGGSHGEIGEMTLLYWDGNSMPMRAARLSREPR